MINTVHWCANLVTHVCQEFGLRLICKLSSLPRIVDLVKTLAQTDYHFVDIVLELLHLAFSSDVDRLRKVSGNGSIRDYGERSHLSREIRRHQVYIVSEILPFAFDIFDFSLSTQNTFRSDFSGNLGDLKRKGSESVYHLVDSL